MNKKPVVIILIIAIAFIAGYFVQTYISFERVQEFGGFPIPKEAEVIKQEENFVEYNWSRASETEGIPRRYQKELEREGWEVIEREGSATIYKKNDIEVLLICQTEYLSLSLTK